MGDFTHLHVHSHYSLLDGLGKIRPMLERAKELGMDSMALTDHGAMYGVIEFMQTAKELGIKPIIGVETYLAPKGHTKKRGKIDSNPRHLTLLAQNLQGYKNMIKLVTTAHLHGYYYRPRIDYDLLEQHSEGLLVLSGCLNGDIAHAIAEKRDDDARQLIAWHINIFGKERFYLEVQDHPSLKEQQILNEALINYSREYDLHLVATADSHYIHADDAEAQDVLICVQTGKQVQDKDRLCMLGEDFSLKSPADLKEAWKEYPDAIESTQRIAELCQVDLEFGVNHLPHYPVPAGQTPDDVLKTLCVQGLATRYHKEPPAGAPARLDYELEVIKKTGFASYFLIVADFVNEAKRRGILVGPGRGSAAGSIVSYLTNITNIDPLHYNLLFERFLNPERVSMPDIDLDFADDRRDEVIAYVREKYGQEHVAQIITFGTMAARAAVRDAGRALGFPYSFCDRIAKAIPLMTNFAEALEESSELREIYNGDPQAKKLIDTARKLEGVCRHASTHAAGVVITQEPLTDHVPLQLASTSSGTQDTVTQYAMGAVEALGLLKMDFLGLKNLTIIQNTLSRIRTRFNTEVDIDHLPLADQKTYQLLQEGKSTGVFQLESSGMKRYLKELKPTEFEDIISMVALYRPGPMDSIPDFIAAKHGQKKITYLHPLLEPILEKTYGVIVTQDQVLQIARELAGFTYAEADILRKAVGKKIKILLDEQREKFIKGAITAKKIDKKTARQVWDFIEPFARYGFNRAHAACYAMIAFQTAYLKAHYPAEFMAALLTSDEGNIDRAAIEVAEAISMGLKILPPDINESGQNFTVVQTAEGAEAIRFGLGAIKNVGHNIVSALIAERDKAGEFKDLADVFSRIDSKDFNKKSVESLAQAGAFDCVAERNEVLHNMEKLLLFNRTLHSKKDLGQKGLFAGALANAAPPRLQLDSFSPATQAERLQWEKELLGMYVSAHPLSEFHNQLQKITVPLSDLTDYHAQQAVRVAGVITRINKIITKSQKPMLFVTLEDMTSKAEVLVFPKLLAQTSNFWTDGGVIICEGKMSDKEGEVKILADKVWGLTPDVIATFTKAPIPQESQRSLASLTAARTILIQLPPQTTSELLHQLRELLAQYHHADGVPVELLIPRQASVVRVQTSFRLQRDEAVTNLIKGLMGSRAVRYQ
ncbi:MAG: DNA polymerase III subunit alpha [Candidatus Andersenbacteria bacterium]